MKMKIFWISLWVQLCLFRQAGSQSLYFPPLTGEAWETIDPASLGWCQEGIDSLYTLLEDNHTKAFILLKDGLIVLEKYFGTFQQDSVWYWASAGKSLTACLVGLAQQEGFLSVDDPTHQYLGEGWTSCDPAQEDQINIWHQLTMTTGLDDGVENPFCTLDTCLLFKSNAGTRWAYHNGPYTLLDDVIESATGLNLNSFFQQRIRARTGITGLFVRVGDNNVFFSRPRSMARFGLWMLNKGNWNGDPVLTDPVYVDQMTNTSQALNLSYGYLWWLNGKASYMLPGLQFVFPGSLMPHAPDDMIMALGKNGQYVNVVPSLNMVLIRMGNAPDGNEVPVTMNDEIWRYIDRLDCTSTQVTSGGSTDLQLKILPNPARDYILITYPDHEFEVRIFSSTGERIHESRGHRHETRIKLPRMAGIYWVQTTLSTGAVLVRRLVVVPD